MAISNCKNCGKEFKYYPSQSGGIYCSNKCQGEHKVREAVESGNYTRSNAMTYFKKHTDYRCNECGITDWNGKKLVLQIDHIDGDNKNNLLSNLRYLCPNCHTQTDTWGVKNASPEGYRRMCDNNRGPSINNGAVV